MSQKKIGPDRFCRSDFYWIQTDRQAKFLYRLNIEYNFFYRPASIHILLVLLTGVVIWKWKKFPDHFRTETGTRNAGGNPTFNIGFYFI